MIARKLKLWLAGLGLISIGGGVAEAQPAPAPAPRAAPPAAWTAYAASVSSELQGWMAENSPPAFQLMTDLVKLQPAAPDARLHLDVRLWIDPDGRVARIETGSGPGSSLEQDLSALALGRRFAAPPPHDMAFPMRLRLAIKPPANPTPAGAAT